jgi:hypothetical protein
MHDVVWQPSATDDLAAVCVDHHDQWAQIAIAENEITNKLQRDPFKYGKHLSEGLWRIIASPIIVFFVVDGDRIKVDSVGWVG